MQIAAILAAVVVLALLVRAITARGERLGAGPSSGVPTAPTEDSIRELVLHGRKIDAIKAYRTLHRVGLKDAKQAVERLAERLPSRP
jgi:ribosomal protein L7/L12